VAQGANLNLKNKQGETPLHVAGEARNLGGVIMLLKAGAAPNELNARGETVLFSFARSQDQRAFQALVAAGVNPDLRGPEGLSARELLNSITEVKELP
jgi:ankyrin repeat protein